MAIRLMRARIAVVAIVGFALTGGCSWMYRTKVESRTQTVRVTTQPPGARVWARSEGESASPPVVAGPAPAELALPYGVEVREFKRGCWLVPAGSVLAVGVGAGDLYLADKLLDDYDFDFSSGWDWLLVIGVGMATYGLMIGGVTGAITSTPVCLYGESQSGTGRLIPTTSVIGASLPGYTDQQVRLTVPSPQVTVPLVLQPAPPAR